MFMGGGEHSPFVELVREPRKAESLGKVIVHISMDPPVNLSRHAKAEAPVLAFPVVEAEFGAVPAWAAAVKLRDGGAPSATA